MPDSQQAIESLEKSAIIQGIIAVRGILVTREVAGFSDQGRS